MNVQLVPSSFQHWRADDTHSDPASGYSRKFLGLVRYMVLIQRYCATHTINQAFEHYTNVLTDAYIARLNGYFAR
jgi:hypothetical protein